MRGSLSRERWVGQQRFAMRLIVDDPVFGRPSQLARETFTLLPRSARMG